MVPKKIVNIIMYLGKFDPVLKTLRHLLGEDEVLFWYVSFHFAVFYFLLCSLPLFLSFYRSGDHFKPVIFHSF